MQVTRETIIGDILDRCSLPILWRSVCTAWAAPHGENLLRKPAGSTVWTATSWSPS